MTKHKNLPPVLSIRQPWAWLIVNGYKDIENRGWNTDYRGEFLVHAGKTPDKEAHNWLQENSEIIVPKIENLDFGGIVGIVELFNVTTQSDSIWFEGPYGFMLRNAVTLPFFPLRGRLGFFNINGIMEIDVNELSKTIRAMM